MYVWLQVYLLKGRSAHGGARRHHHPGGPDARGCRGGGGGRSPTDLHLGRPQGKVAHPPPMGAHPAWWPVGVWDTGTGAFVGALHAPEPGDGCKSLLTYRRPSEGRPRVAGAFVSSHLCIWDGDDLQLLHTIQIDDITSTCQRLAVYEEPTSGRTRLVTG
jgi:hypothetical protein